VQLEQNNGTWLQAPLQEVTLWWRNGFLPMDESVWGLSTIRTGPHTYSIGKHWQCWWCGAIFGSEGL